MHVTSPDVLLLCQLTNFLALGPIRTRPYFVFVSWIGRPIHKIKTRYGPVRIGSLFENGAPQRQAVGTFDVCLARPKVCPTDIVRPHAAQLMIDTSVNQFSKIWPSADWPLLWRKAKRPMIKSMATLIQIAGNSRLTLIV